METGTSDSTRVYSQLISDPMTGIHAYPQLETISSALQWKSDDKDSRAEGVIRPHDAVALIRESVRLTNNNFSQDNANNCAVFGLEVFERTLQLPHERQPEILVNFYYL